MIKFLTLFLLLTSLNGETFTYLLPDEYSSFEEELIRLSKNHPIMILTPTMNHPTFKKLFLKNCAKGYPLTLITSTPTHDPAHLIAYQNVQLYLYRARKLEGTWILIDNTTLCHISSPLDSEILSDTAQTAHCSDDPTLVMTLTKKIQLLQKRSHLYLK